MSRLFPQGSRIDLIASAIGLLAGAYRGAPAICIGNGESRAGFDLGQLPPRGRALFLGCNLLHEELGDRLDALVALDEKMARECMARAQIQGPLIVRAGVLRKYRGELRSGTWAIGLPRTATEFTSASGVMSIAVAMAAGCSPIYAVGHDLEPGSMIYRGRGVYAKGTRNPSAKKVAKWLGALRVLAREYDGHLFQVETYRVPGAEKISWEVFLQRFTGDRVEVRK